MNKTLDKVFMSCKRAFIWKPTEIAIAGIMLAVGLVANIWFKIGNWHVATIAIYMFMAVSLPFGIALLTTFLIDFLTMVFTIGVGAWWWSFALGPLLVVIIAKGIFAALSIGERLKTKWLIPAMFTLFTIIAGSVYFGVENHMLSFDKQLIHGRLETDDKKSIRLIQQYIALISFIVISVLLIINTTKLYLGKAQLFKINLFITMLVTTFLFDVMYNPFSIMNWYITAPNSWVKMDSFNVDYYKFLVSIGVSKMFVHLFFATPILVSIYISYRHIPSFKDKWV